MKTQLVMGRLLLGLIFLISGLSKLTNYDVTLMVMKDQGLRATALLLPLAIAIEVLGGTALIFGFRLRNTCLLLAAYLVPVTLIFHRFWDGTGETRQLQGIEFLKNCSIIGGLVLTATYQKILAAYTGGTLTSLRKESFERRKAA